MKKLIAFFVLLAVIAGVAQIYTPGGTGTGSGTTVSGSITGAYSFNGPFSVVNATNVYLNSVISNLALNPPFTNTALISGAISNHNTWYVSPNGTNASAMRGRPDRAAADPAYVAQNYATSGDTILLAPGIYNLGMTNVNLPHGVNMIGAGSKATIIKSDVALATNGTVIGLGSSSRVAMVSIELASSGSRFQAGIGGYLNQKAFTNAIIHDVEIVGQSDCFYIGATNPCTISIFNVLGTSKWDVVYIENATSAPGHVVDIFSSTFIADAKDATLAAAISANTNAGGSGVSGVQVEDYGVLRLFNCDITITNVFKGRCVRVLSDGGNVEIHGGSMVCAGTNLTGVNKIFLLENGGVTSRFVYQGFQANPTNTSGDIEWGTPAFSTAHFVGTAQFSGLPGSGSTMALDANGYSYRTNVGSTVTNFSVIASGYILAGGLRVTNTVLGQTLSVSNSVARTMLTEVIEMLSATSGPVSFTMSASVGQVTNLLTLKDELSDTVFAVKSNGEVVVSVQLSMPSGATSNYVWTCTNATSGRGEWRAQASSTTNFAVIATGYGLAGGLAVTNTVGASNIIAGGITVTGAPSGMITLQSSNGVASHSFTVPGSLTNSVTNSFAFTNGTAGQTLVIASNVNNQIYWITATPSAGGGSAVGVGNDSGMINNQTTNLVFASSNGISVIVTSNSSGGTRVSIMATNQGVIGARVNLANDWIVPDNSLAGNQINWTNVDFNAFRGSHYFTSSAPSRITIPTGMSGRYLVGFHVETEMAGYAAPVTASLIVDGTTTLVSGASSGATNTAGSGLTTVLTAGSTVYDFTGGQYIELAVASGSFSSSSVAKAGRTAMYCVLLAGGGGETVVINQNSSNYVVSTHGTAAVTNTLTVGQGGAGVLNISNASSPNFLLFTNGQLTIANTNQPGFSNYIAGHPLTLTNSFEAPTNTAQSLFMRFAVNSFQTGTGATNSKQFAEFGYIPAINAVGTTNGVFVWLTRPTINGVPTTNMTVGPSGITSSTLTLSSSATASSFSSAGSSGGSMTVNATGGFLVSGKSRMYNLAANGTMDFYNAALTDFNGLFLGGQLATNGLIQFVSSSTGNSNSTVKLMSGNTNVHLNFEAHDIGTRRTNWTADATSFVGTTNTSTYNQIWNVRGTSGNIVFWNRTGLDGATAAGVAIWTNTVTTTGSDIVVGVNCGIAVDTGVGVVGGGRAF